jgi:nucleotide-binding universal stress UspA family protein
LRVGNPREVIVEMALRILADVLIIGSHSKRGIFDIALGGTAQQISSHAPCPVLLVSPKP